MARDGSYVLYWMIAQRRARRNLALQHAAHRARELGRPLLVLEALRCGYPWASDRLHDFVLDGMVDNARDFAAAGVRYHAYVEPREGAGRGLLEALARRACLVVTDEFPCFFLPRMVAAAGRVLPVRLEQVDGLGLLPLRATDRSFPTAHAFRRHLQRSLPEHLADFPVEDPLAGLDRGPRAAIPREVLECWPAAGNALDDGRAALLATLPIDHGVVPTAMRGGSRAAGERLQAFVTSQLARYAKDRNQPEEDATSRLSTYLHFGHVSAHAVVAAVMESEGWDPGRLASRASGSREGWWGMSAPAEAFLDELVTWRELGHVFAFHHEDHDRYESLPEWAQRTLADHVGDPREHVYSLEEFAGARTHDPLWNAAQMQLVHEGRIHNYLRMLWGKKILEWTEDPPAALDVMVELNNRFALDGRDPNSYSGIFWVLGRFDRAWGPERAIYGKVRYMTSENTARKVRVRDYIERWTGGQ